MCMLQNICLNPAGNPSKLRLQSAQKFRIWSPLTNDVGFDALIACVELREIAGRGLKIISQLLLLNAGDLPSEFKGPAVVAIH